MTPKLFLIAMVLGVAASAAEPPQSAPTFHKDVLPILQQNCQSCHRPGQIAPMSLLTYESTRPWARAIKNMVATKQMPPWNADAGSRKLSNDASLEQRDIDTIVAWVDQGAPEGDPKDQPAPIDWPEAGWQIEPDFIVKGPETFIPAEAKNNVIEWFRVAMPTGLKEDTWVTSIEVRPSEPELTHHICIHFMPHNPDVKYDFPYWNEVERDERGNEIPRAKGARHQESLEERPDLRDTGEGEACYLPGLQSLMDYRSKNTGKLIPAGTDIVFSLHYLPSGREAVDRPQVGFTIADQVPDRRYVSLTVRGPQDAENFAIPPNDPNWAAPHGEATFAEDAEIAWLSPHMHLRGKSFSFLLERPDGSSETILKVPQFDFNWQLGYEFEEPIPVTKGTKLITISHFDNSVNNKFNPDPSQTVYYGGMTWEEMSSGFVGMLLDKDVDPDSIFEEKD